MTDEFKDLTGILDRLTALQGAILLKRSAAGLQSRPIHDDHYYESLGPAPDPSPLVLTSL
jgi:hypothetical protein